MHVHKAFCWCLHKAIRGEYPGLNLLSVHALLGVVADFRARPRRQGLQARIYKAIAEAAIDPWHGFVNRRLDTLGPQCRPFNFDQSRVEFCKNAKEVGPGIMMTVIKAMSNSWVTSRRFHEETRLSCIFGCEGQEDTLAHYLSCEPFWTLLISSCRLGMEWLSVPPSSRLGVNDPSRISFLLITVASRVYHAIRRDNPEAVRHAFAQGDFCRVHDLVIELASFIFRDIQ